jgi:hypothetical protein
LSQPSENPSEYSYTNNLASNEISVQLTLEESDLIVDGESTFTFTGASFTHRGKIVVKDNDARDTGAPDRGSNFDNESRYVTDNGSIVCQATLNSTIRCSISDNGRLSLDNPPVGGRRGLDDTTRCSRSSTTQYRLIAPIVNGVVYATTQPLLWIDRVRGNARLSTSVAIPPSSH